MPFLVAPFIDYPVAMLEGVVLRIFAMIQARYLREMLDGVEEGWLLATLSQGYGLTLFEPINLLEEGLEACY